jgi:thiosulfate dehydrogenase
MTRSMNGRPLPLDSPQMTAIVTYLKFLSTGQRVGAPTFGRGPGRMVELTRAADSIRGKVVYTQTCAACHGGNGGGSELAESVTPAATSSRRFGAMTASTTVLAWTG